MNDRDNSRSGWYAPMEAQAPAAKKRRSHKALWICLGIAALLALIIISSVALAGTGRAQLPGAQMPDDWQSFMDEYFTQPDGEDWVSNVPKAEGEFSMDMELHPAGGEEQLSLQELFAKCSKSVVAISCETEGLGAMVWGSGVIASADGLIITNAHVVEGCETATVTLYDDSDYDAKLVAADPLSDLAVLKIEAEGLPAAQLGDSDELLVGDRVVAIGNPLSETFRATLTDGVVSGIGRGLNYKGYTMKLIQTNAAINSGNSGGALFNMYGQLVGITNMKMVSYNNSVEGIGFAIPSTTVRQVVASLLEHGKVIGRASIGITVGQIPKGAAEEYELPMGLYISAVSPGSDAEKKGILPGDILTAINGEPVRSTDDVAAVRDSCQVGDTISMTIWREGQELEVEVALVERDSIY